MKRTPIKPMSDRRRAERAADGDRFPASTFRPAPPTKRTTVRPAQTGPDPATVDAVLNRDGHSCVVCGGALHGTRGVDWSVHHRLRRSQGGGNRLSNLVSVCGHGAAGDHGLIHAAPAKARDAGWLLRRGDDPKQVPLAHAQYGHIFLLNNGSWQSRRPAQTNESEG